MKSLTIARSRLRVGSRLLVAFLYPAPALSGRLWIVGFCACLLAGLLLGYSPFLALKINGYRTAEVLTSTVRKESIHKDGLGYFIYARDAGVEEAIAALPEGTQLGAFDSNQHPQRSKHRIIVNGNPLPSPHRPHAAIRLQKSGGYSFWQGSILGDSGIYFSLPSGVEIDSPETEIVIEWHVETTSDFKEITQVVAVCVTVLLALAIAGFLMGSVPLALLGILSTAPWGAALAVFVPNLTALPADVIQLSGIRFVYWWSHVLVLIAGIVWATLLIVGRLWTEPKANNNAACVAGMLVATALGLCYLRLGVTWVAASPIADWSAEGAASAVVGGRLPFSDAAAWYLGAKALLQGAEVEWCARRPLHALLRAGELMAVGSHYQLSLLLQTTIVGLSIGGLCSIFARTAGWSASILLLVGLVTFAGGFLGSYLSEASGLAAACIGLGLMLAGCSQGDWWWRFAGYFFFALAAAMRPGPLLMLSALPVAEWLLFPKMRWLRAVGALFTILLAFAMSSMAFRAIAADSAAANANAANTVLGLAMGTNWSQATDQFYSEDPTRRELSAKQISSLMYKVAWDKFKNDPHSSVAFLAKNLGDGLSILFCEVPSRALKLQAGQWVLWTIVLIMLFSRARQGEKWPLQLGLLSVAMILSFPLIWTDGGWRGLTTGMPVFLALMAVVFSLPWSKKCRRPCSSEYILMGSGLLMLLVTLMGLLRYAASPNLDNRDPSTVSFCSDPVISVVAGQPAIRTFGQFEVSHHDFVASIAGAGLSVYGIDQTFKKLSPPFLVALVGRDNVSEGSLLMFFPGLQIHNKASIHVNNYKVMPDGYTAEAEKWTFSK
jgi:hypothetical protein